MTSHRPSPLRAGLAALAAGAGLALAGCNADRIVESAYPETVSQRHPIVLSEGAERLDLPVGAGGRGVTERQREDIRAFAAGWRKSGRGPIGMMTPKGGAGDFASPAIRTTLAAAGVPATSIISSRYAGDPGGAPIVKLGYVRLKAGVPHPCGLWPEDLGRGGAPDGVLENNDYWNLGCATQQNIAAQVADPEDLARPRAETPIYAARRSGVIDKHRKGEDTTTQYRQEDAVVSDVAAN